jgi:hypothetical protein
VVSGRRSRSSGPASNRSSSSARRNSTRQDSASLSLRTPSPHCACWGSEIVSPRAGLGVGRAEIRNPRGDLLTVIDYEALGWETYGILRSELQQAMLEAVPPERLRLGTTCVAATAEGQALLDGAEPLVADLVVGADGMRSTVRRSLFGGGAAALRRPSRVASRDPLR